MSDNEPLPEGAHKAARLALFGVAAVLAAMLALVAMALWTMAQPPQVDVEAGAGALLPGLVPAGSESSILDAAAGERTTSKGGTSLTVRWEGPVDADMEADRAAVFEGLYGERMQGAASVVVAGGHEAIRAELELDGHEGAIANWRCPVSRRAFTLLAMAESMPDANGYLDEAIALVACHGHGQVAFPEARWTPPEAWEDEGVSHGIHWFAGPDQRVGMAVLALADAEGFVEDCPADLGITLAMELSAAGATLTSQARPLEEGCGATVALETAEGIPMEARLELMLCDHIGLRLFHHLYDGAEPHVPEGLRCVVVAEG